MKPAHCKNALGPSLGTFKSSFLEVKRPFASRYSTIFLARVLFIPDICSISGAEAVLRSTPTLFTQSSTTASRALVSFFWFMSCWYWPTPMALGSIFTSSASGSSRRLAIEAALRCPTSKLGNSSVASLLAE